jgi:anti-sigma factor RsiW
MACEVDDEFIEMYVKGSFQDDLAPELIEHLTTCSFCTKRVAERTAQAKSVDTASDDPQW